MIKRRTSRPTRRINQYELISVFSRDAIPEPVVRDPCWTHSGAQRERRRVVVHKLFGPRIIVCGQRMLLCGARNRDQETRQSGADDAKWNATQTPYHG